ncbi:MAG: flippase [Candidatus Methanoperedenaceae archaeon]|nr:flippase [Candidatus Methanoperedenaceae archaeon]
MGIGAVQRQSIVSLIWQIAFTFIALLSTMYFSHAVGASVLGAYFLFMAYLGIIGLFTDGGFGGAAIKRISEGEEQDAYFSAFFVLRSLFTTAVVIALIAFRSHFVDFNNAGTFIWLLLALIVSNFYGTVSHGIAGCGKMGIYTTCNFINDISRILVQVVAIFLGYGVAGLAGGFVAGMLVGGIIELHFFDLHLVHFSWRHIKSLSTFSFWVFLTSSGMLVFSYADTIMIGYFMNNADVGVYRIVLQFTLVASFAANAILSTLWPKVSRWGKTGEIELIEESLSRAFSYSLLLAVPVVAGGVLLGDKLLYFLYGAEFATGYPVLIILLIVQVINIFFYFILSYISALDRQKDSFKVTAVAAATNIVLNFLLIPVLGIVGAAVSTLVSMVLNLILARRVLSQMIRIRLEHDSLLNFIKASIVMSIFIMAYRMLIPLANVWLTLVPVFLGGAMYGILILKFDRKIYKELKGILAQMNLK